METKQMFHYYVDVIISTQMAWKSENILLHRINNILQEAMVKTARSPVLSKASKKIFTASALQDSGKSFFLYFIYAPHLVSWNNHLGVRKNA